MNPVQKEELPIEVAISAVLLLNAGTIVYCVALFGMKGLNRIIPPSNWGFVFLIAAALLRLISDSDYPEAIRKSKALRTHLRLLYVWSLLLGILFISVWFFLTVPDLIVICAASIFAVISISMVIVHSLHRMNAR
jgi:hypothetical protein